jgi:hypothetical protein
VTLVRAQPSPFAAGDRTLAAKAFQNEVNKRPKRIQSIRNLIRRRFVLGLRSGTIYAASVNIEIVDFREPILSSEAA